MKRASIYCALLCTGAFLFSSCIDKDLYKGSPKEEKDALSGFEYAQQFENFGFYRANITSSVKTGRFYSIYTSFPYNEDNEVVAEPILNGLTPIDAQIAVPYGTTNLYVVNDEGVKAYKVGDLKIADDETRANLSKSDFDILKSYIDNNLLPEAKYNIKAEDLYKCTDLYADVPEGGTVTVWVSLVRKNDVPGPVWYYIYSGDNPTIDDVQFYGQNGTTPVKLTFDEIKKDKKYPILNSGTSTNMEIELATKLTAGQNIGFVYRGNLGWRFTTPSLNVLPYTTQDGTWKGKGGVWPDDTPIDSIIPYTEGAFKIEHPVLGGALIHFSCYDSDHNLQEYNVIGFENRLPAQRTQDTGGTSGTYDGDYNDMVFLIRSNPEYIKPKEEVPVPELIFTTKKVGMWIFEDNYPETGDFDFNDVVVYYQIKTIGAPTNLTEVTCWLAAKGCTYNNEIGVIRVKNTTNKEYLNNPEERAIIFKDVHGYKNVGENGNTLVDLSNMPRSTVRLAGTDLNKVRPYLYNGVGRCTPETFNTTNYPYALDIPGESNDVFRWPTEGSSIDECYWFLKNKKGGARDKDWYCSKNDQNGVPQNIKDLSKVIVNTKENTIINQAKKDIKDEYK